MTVFNNNQYDNEAFLEEFNYPECDLEENYQEPEDTFDVRPIYDEVFQHSD